MASQRYSDEDDLLERSTNKPKVDDGLQDAIDSDAADGSPSEMVPDAHTSADGEVVAETQLEEMPGADRPESDMQIEADSTPNPAPVVEPAQLLPVDPNPVDSGAERPRSYLDSVVGKGTDATPFLVDNIADAGGDDLNAEEVPDDEDDDPTCPTVRLSVREKEQIREPWRQTLIIKVMGRRVGYAYLLRRLTTMWKPKGRLELIALENDYFLVRFGLREDLEFAKYEGPWMTLDHYLIVKDWVPTFDPTVDTTENVLVWVRFPNLPVEFYNLLCLRKIGNKLGRTVRVDHTTSLVSRGKFARVCVEIDITKPLISTFTLEGKVWKVAYEGIHLVCFACGMYGHRLEACPTAGESVMDGSEGSTTPRPPQSAGPAHANTPQGPDKGKATTSRIRPYGSWMIVTRKERRQSRRPQGAGQSRETVTPRLFL
ncbi:uncharacterized protein LOC116029652 [Ipomoea triloba]|uniref:uncharacterized protein LOC116029652 n=1 Tax=Ipomoea triloba TaxID=35885 RepID=UPI00125CD54E|nr:uncharacterized protein LOC116029652 [Ipomoea triloba]